MIVLDLSILNQKGTPMFNSDTFANRPNFGIVGRIFISTDTSEIYRDTGTSWVLIADTSAGGTITGSGTTGTIPIWSGSTSLGNSIVTQTGSTIEIKATGSNDSVLNIDTTTGDYSRIEFQNAGNLRSRIYFHEPSNELTIGTYVVGGKIEFEVDNNITALTIDSTKNSIFFGNISAIPSLTAANNAASIAAYAQNTLSYAAAFSSNNIGAIYGAVGGINLQTFAGSATFAQANLASAGVFVNSIDFSSGSSTITMTQSSGIRAMTGNQAQLQYQGTNSGTISHAAVQQNLGFYRPSSASGVLTITNAYSHLINALDDYGAGFTFTNRFGIYQAGASDVNYFAASVLIGTLTNTGEKLIVNGNIKVIGTITATNGTLIGGTGTTNFLPKFTGASTIGNSQVFDNGTSVGINTPSPLSKLDVRDASAVMGNYQTIQAFSTDSAGINLGAGISLGGFYSGTSLIAQFGSIVGRKENSTSGNYDGYLAFGTNNQATGVVERMRLDASGNLGLGVTPSAWGTASARVAIEMSTGGSSIWAQNFGGSNPSMQITCNYFEAAGGSIRKVQAEASYYGQNAGSHQWYSAPSGAAASTISFTQAMTLHNTNNLSLGSINDTGNRFYLNGSLRIDGQTSGTAGGNSGQHLIINLDGTQYKIKLENN